MLEGPDGVGKSTVVRALAGRLRDTGVVLELISFPGRASGTLGKVVYELHHAPDTFSVGEITPAAMQALHVAAHLDVIERTMLPTLAAGRHLVLDRFWWSTRVYGIVDGVPAPILDALIDAERCLWGSRAPASVILLDRDAPINRDGEDLERWGRLRREYLATARREAERGRVDVIRNTSAVDDTVSTIVQALTEAGAPFGRNER